MSALGRKRTFAVQNGMSALTLKADICSARADVRFGQKRTHAAQQMGSLLDHLVSAGEQRWRQGQTEHPSGLDIDHQLERCCLYDWKVRRLRALEDATDIDAHLTIRVHEIWSVTH